MFENGLSIGEKQKSKKQKKLSVKQKKYQKLLDDKQINMQRNKNPLDLIGHQGDSIDNLIEKEKLSTLSRGQRKRLEKKVTTFQGKKFMLEKSQKMKLELKQ